MRKKSTPTVLFATALALFARLSFSETNTIVIPKEAQATFGNEEQFAFGGAIQQVYAASEFAAIPTDVILITEIAFRADESYTSGAYAWPGIQINLNVFPGSMADIVQRKSGLTDSPPPTAVFNELNVHFNARTGDVSAFDLRFPLQHPFTYDRRQGQLVLSLAEENRGLVDAQGIYNVPGDPTSGTSHGRGVYIYRDEGWLPAVSSQIIVTKFSYASTFAVINAISAAGGTAQIDFKLYGSPGSVQIVTSPDVAGSYVAAENAQITMNPDGTSRASVPMCASRQFIRIKLN